MLTLEQAQKVLKLRREKDLLTGLTRRADLDLLPDGIRDLLASVFGPHTYGRWDYLYPTP